MKKTRIGIFGGSSCHSDVYEKAREVGRLLARRGILVYCGGLRGIMEAVSRGISDENGMVVGILPGPDCEQANDYVTVPVATGAGAARNIMIANCVQGAIAIDGRYGTLSEIAHTLKQGKPVVGLDTWEIDGVQMANTPEEAVNMVLELI